MILKLDLEKAYDRLRWEFIEDTLIDLGFPTLWIDRIMKCVSTGSMRLLWNDEMSASFPMTRGIRQGDPISPYLFVLCLERLGHLIDKAVVEGEWKPIQISRGGPKISHLFFADDILLFAEASERQLRIVKSILDSFCGASGHKVSLSKSKLFVSHNVRGELESLLSNVSSIPSTRRLGSYLGIPVFHGRVSNASFNPLLEKVTSRLAGWKSHTLNISGRVTLTKPVLATIPLYTMHTVLLPAVVCSKLDKICRNFICGSNLGTRKIHLIKWNFVCKPKRRVVWESDFRLILIRL